MHKKVKQLQIRGGEVTVRWIASHNGIEGKNKLIKLPKKPPETGEARQRSEAP